MDQHLSLDRSPRPRGLAPQHHEVAFFCHGEPRYVRVPISSYERCMAEGQYAETIADKLKGVMLSVLSASQ
jgi:hypothetical protein